MALPGFGPNTPMELSPTHKHMCALKAAGLNNNEIAEATGYNYASVSQILKHPDAHALIDRLSTDLVRNITQDVSQQITAATGEALGTVLSLMRTAESEQVRQRSAFDILDRGGFKPREVHVNAEVQLPKEDARHIHETLQQLGREIPVRPPVDNAVHLLTKSEKPVESDEAEEKIA